MGKGLGGRRWFDFVGVTVVSHEMFAAHSCWSAGNLSIPRIASQDSDLPALNAFSVVTQQPSSSAGPSLATLSLALCWLLRSALLSAAWLLPSTSSQRADLLQ